jgi:S-adenosylmethionine:tRNA-ribosyltransferase-isomerase (queuine synthetase)
VKTSSRPTKSLAGRDAEQVVQDQASTSSSDRKKIRGIKTDNETEVLIDAPVDKVRSRLVVRYVREKYTLDKEDSNQLVFSKESGGLKGNLAGIFFGKGARNPRVVLTFIVMKSGRQTLLMLKSSYLYPDHQGKGNVRDVDTKSNRRSIASELSKIKAEVEAAN